MAAMSDIVGPQVHYHCANDCKQEGCPGHTMRMRMTSASTYRFTKDEGMPTEYSEYFDEDYFHAMVEAYEGTI